MMMMMMMMMMKVGILLTVMSVGTLATPLEHPEYQVGTQYRLQRNYDANPDNDRDINNNNKYIYYNDPSNNNNNNYTTEEDDSYSSYSDVQRLLYTGHDNYNYDLEKTPTNSQYKHDYNIQEAADEYYEGSNYHPKSSPYERQYDQIIQDSVAGNYEDAIYNSISDLDVNKEIYGHGTPGFNSEASDVPEHLYFINETTGQVFFDALYERPDFKVFRNVKDFLTSRLGPEHHWDDRLPVERQDGGVDTGLGLAIIGGALIAQLILVSTLLSACNNNDDNDRCTTNCDLPAPVCTTSTCTPPFLFRLQCQTTCQKRTPTCTTTCSDRKKRDLSSWLSGWSEEGGMVSKATKTIRDSGLWNFMEGFNILPGGTEETGETGRVLCDVAGRFLM